MAYTLKLRTYSLRSPLRVGALSVLLALASSAHEAHADLPAAAAAPAAAAPAAAAPAAKTAPARPTFRLQYHLQDSFSQEYCPMESVARSMLNHVFRYQVIDDHAGPGFAIDIMSSSKPPHFEILSYLLRADELPITTWRVYRAATAESACFMALHQAVIALWGMTDIDPDQLKAPPEPDPEPVMITPVVRHALPDAPPAPAPPPTPSVTVTLPSSAPAWKRPQGFMLTAGLTATVGLTPTPSLGGVAGLNFRRGAWSGGIEARLDRTLMPADIQRLNIESLYAGAALVAPCVHEGVFSGCFVLEGGGYSFSHPKESSYLTGRYAMLGLGFRANLEHRVGEHFLLRGFMQISAMPVTPSIDFPANMAHLWNSGPAFGTLGLTFISIP